MRTKWLTVYEGWPDTEFGSGSKSGQKPVENSGLVPYTFRWGSCSKPPGTRTPLPLFAKRLASGAILRPYLEWERFGYRSASCGT